METPGPEHAIALSPSRKRMRVRFQNHVIADTAQAVVLEEADYPPAIYFPRADVDTGFLSRTAHSTHCPYKGDASYYTLQMNGELAENVAWSYEAPYPAMSAIEGMLAFYPDRVEVYEIDDAALADRRRPEFVESRPSPGGGPR